MLREYKEYIISGNKVGSNKAASYIKALEYIGPILKQSNSVYSKFDSIWEVVDVEFVSDLYKYILEQQKLGHSGIFQNGFPKSYWKGGFYSAAIKSYLEFLIIMQYESELWPFVDQIKDAKKLGSVLNQKEIKHIEKLADETTEFSGLEGKSCLALVKKRINQDFFRKMVLKNFSSRCCITGLNIPEVLRASHIIPWSKDKENRLNPENGLCLSATYDAAFDRYLISFDDKYRLVLGKTIKDNATYDAVKEHFIAFEGKEMLVPRFFMPAKDFLQKHLDSIC
ncbi:MAG: HNH endonuclease [Sedimentisphaeraceae bacterium JB056]